MFFSYTHAFGYFVALFKRAHMLLLQLQTSQLQPAKQHKFVVVDNYFNQVYTSCLHFIISNSTRVYLWEFPHGNVA